jgi:hypothetical protein
MTNGAAAGWKPVLHGCEQKMHVSLKSICCSSGLSTAVRGMEEGSAADGSSTTDQQWQYQCNTIVTLFLNTIVPPLPA